MNSIRSLLAFVAAAFYCLSAIGFPSEQFAVATSDGSASLHGQFDYPGSFSGTSPVILMVGGTGLFDRDYLFGNSDTDKDFLFRVLSQRFTQQGFIVARFDYRGVRCNRRTAPKCDKCVSREDRIQDYVSKCIVNSERSTVTPENIRDDIKSVYETVTQNPRVDKSRIIIFAHSEGTLHVSYLVNQKRIFPKGLLFMGAIGESAQSIMKWQAADIRGKVATYSWWPFDLNNDGRIENSEIDTFCHQYDFPVTACDVKKSPTGFWDSINLSKRLKDDYASLRNEVLQHEDREPFNYELAQYGAVFASYRWWKMFFSDTRDVASLLVNFSGKVSLNNGDIDLSTPSTREFAKFDQSSMDPALLRKNVYLRKGHSLTDHPQLGPIEEPSIEALLEEATWLIQ